MDEQDLRNAFVEGSPASELFASISIALVDKLAERCELPIPKDIFRKNLHIALVYFYFDSLPKRYPEKKVFRRQLETLNRTANQFISALKNLNDASLKDAQDWLEEPEFLKWMALNPEAEEDPVSTIINFDALHTHILEIGKWCQIELDRVNQEPTDMDKFLGSNLDKLLIRLGSLFEQYNNCSAKSACYYDSVNDGYKGKFYEFALEILDACAPGSYFSHGALGKRIVRTLAKDIKVKSLT